MTNSTRVLFRNVLTQPPEGFTRFLSLKVPLREEERGEVPGTGTVILRPRSDVRFSNMIEYSKYSMDDLARRAVEYFARRTYSFSVDPSVDPLERLVAPGSERFSDSLLDESGITEPTERHIGGRQLSGIIREHEVSGHLDTAFSPDKAAEEAIREWGHLLAAGQDDYLETYARPFGRKIESDPEKATREMMTQTLIKPAHEVYAMMQEERLWRRLQEGRDSGEVASKLRKTIRGARINNGDIAMGVLEYMSDKTSGNLQIIKEIMDTLLEKHQSLSYALTSIIYGLSKGGDIEAFLDEVKGSYDSMSSDDHDLWNPRSTTGFDMNDPVDRANFTTFINLKVDDPGTLGLDFYSVEPTDFVNNTLKLLACITEAKRILDSSGQNTPLSPHENYASQIIDWIWRPAAAKGKVVFTPYPYRYGEIESFYSAWKSAQDQAKMTIFGNLLDQS